MRPMKIEFCKKQLAYIHEIMDEIKEKIAITTNEDHKNYLENDLQDGKNELQYWTRHLEYAEQYYSTSCSAR